MATKENEKVAKQLTPTQIAVLVSTMAKQCQLGADAALEALHTARESGKMVTAESAAILRRSQRHMNTARSQVFRAIQALASVDPGAIAPSAEESAEGLEFEE